MYYTVAVTYPGFSRETEMSLEKAVGRRSDFSGFCFADGSRDIGWAYKREAYAIRAFEKVKSTYPDINVSFSGEDY